MAKLSLGLKFNLTSKILQASALMGKQKIYSRYACVQTLPFLWKIIIGTVNNGYSAVVLRLCKGAHQ